MNIPTWDRHLGAWQKQAGRAAAGFSQATAAITPEQPARRNSRITGSLIPRPTEHAAVNTLDRIRKARTSLTAAGDELLDLAELRGIPIPDQHALLRPHQRALTATQICAWTHEAAQAVHHHVVNDWARRQIDDRTALGAFDRYRDGLRLLTACTRHLSVWLPEALTPQPTKTCGCRRHGCPCKNCGCPNEKVCSCRQSECKDQLLESDREVSDRCRQRIARHNRSAEGSAA